jgi:hypothetical protein
MYPCPDSPLPAPLNDAEVFEVVDDAGGDVLAQSLGARTHPEVPLTLDQRDSVVTRLGYRRTGPWIEEPDGWASASVIDTRAHH